MGTNKRFRYFVVAASATALSALGMAAAGSASTALADGQNGTTLTETITANPSYTKTFGWSITKSADPTTLNLFKGDTGSANYTVTVTKDVGTVAASVSGQVCITNGGAVDTQDLQSTLELSMPPDQTVIQSQPLDVSSEPVIPGSLAAPYQTACYPYTMTINNPVPGGSYKITADTTILNHSGHLGVPFGPAGSATFSLPQAPTLVNNSVDVSDSMAGDLGSTDHSQSFLYSHTFNCLADQGKQTNTAQISYASGPGPTASADVQVNCYSLGVSKTADTSFTRTWTWGINKSADQSNLTLAAGETYPVNYTVNVTATSADSNFAVGGAITVHNPAPIDATINSVSDVLPGGSQVTLTDAPKFPYTLAAGQDLVIHYTGSLADSSSGTNTATATLQNTPSANGTTDFSGSVGYSFDLSNPSTVVAGQADITDTYAGDLGTVNATDMPKAFSYQRIVGPYASPGTYTVPNTASFTDSNGGTGNSSWTVNVNVPSNGCTLTIGYWKTHPAQMAKYLPILLGNAGLGQVNVTTTAQGINILQFQGNASNGINKLLGQELGAKLSIASGADPSAVSSTITAADVFLATHPASSWSSLTKAQQTQVNGWATTLDNYNNGLTGPGHCSQ